jgi:2,3-bisphosphoglycerate-dependent phosphoglycerate mutase
VPGNSQKLHYELTIHHVGSNLSRIFRSEYVTIVWATQEIYFTEVVSEDMPTVLLIRHGESRSNVGLPTSSPKLVDLTSKGSKQARDIAWLLNAHFSPELIVTSSYLRTKQTAAPTKSAFPYISEEEWPVHEFTYLSPSYWNEDTSLKDRQPLVDAYWEICNPFYVDGPESESFEEFIERVRKVKLRLLSTRLDKIVLFSHEQFISALLWLSKRDHEVLFPDMMRSFRAFLKAYPIPNGAIVQVKYHRGDNVWRYEMITFHLSHMRLASSR